MQVQQMKQIQHVQPRDKITFLSFLLLAILTVALLRQLGSHLSQTDNLLILLIIAIAWPVAVMKEAERRHNIQ
jgi:hypothetical protein